ncbi:putative coat protein YlbD-like [Scopulibacillus darangshiensis]|uniref:Putative coat protein YlbD-like n=1 Tax=Scopulibacillus darangshiensis TaxID=442528 RepID=A0A4R2P6G8_9BACL|nr:spore coat protein YlbD [Scopulibacillus darangshiensis]TCP30490.1 putative coat protein YlbD-like [Scopulibacillus darangshiensis]
MAREKTAESIKAFKRFVQEHPELVKGVKEQDKTWNDIFEEWVLFGEDHEIWETYGIETKSEKSSSGDGFKKILSFINDIDTNNLQERLELLNGALNNIQDLIVQFQPKKDTGLMRQSYISQPTQGYQTQSQTYENQPYMYKRD